MTNEMPQPGITTERLRSLGLYEGDGKQKSISIQDEFGFILHLATHYAQSVLIGIAMFIVLSSYNSAADTHTGSGESLVFSAIFTGVLIVTWTILDLLSHNRYLKARLFFKASVQEAWYWQGNFALRGLCVQPQDKVAFKQVIYAANRLDRERALAYVAEEVWGCYSRLTSERNLGMERVPRGWFMRQIMQDADRMEKIMQDADPEDYVAQQE